MLTLIALFTAAAAIQFIVWLVIGWAGRRRHIQNHPVQSSPHEAISVVVAVRDGVETLPDLFDALEKQSSRDFELVIVDDHSTDGTADQVRAFAARALQLRLVENPGRGKKDAVTAGISAAVNDLIALTDADCVPGPHWLRELRLLHAGMEEGIVVGYGPYRPRSGLLNRFVRFETLHTAVLLRSAIALGHPYMAVGRNISYRKSTFERLGGLEQATDLLSGDDDLFVQSAAADAVSVRFMAAPESFVFSEAPSTFSDWIRQKRRHLSTGRRYHMIPAFGLAVYHVSALLCWIAPFVAGWIGVGCLLCRLVPGQLVVGRASLDLKEAGLSLPFVPLDLLFQIYLVLVAPLAWLKPPKSW